MQRIKLIYQPETLPESNSTIPYAALAIGIVLAGYSYMTSSGKKKQVEEEEEEEEEEN